MADPDHDPAPAAPDPGEAARLLREAAARLRGIEAGNPRLEAEYLLAAALREDRVALFRRRAGEPVPAAARARLERLLARRLSREPLQYVLGTVPFCELELEIGPGALIPRAETEMLVERAAAALLRGRAPVPPAERPPASGSVEPATPPRPPRLLLDVGTGSGAILLAMLRRLPGWTGVGLDRSREALAWALRNRRRSAAGDPDLARRAWLARSDLLAAVRPGSAGAVLSNPPYIRTEEIPRLAPEIRDFEPVVALDGGPDGLEPFRRLLPDAARVLAPGGLLAVELAPDQPEAAAALVEAAAAFLQPEIFHDLAGRPRGILAWRAD